MRSAGTVDLAPGAGRKVGDMTWTGDHMDDGSDRPDVLMTAGRFGSLTLLSAKALRIYADRDCCHRPGAPHGVPAASAPPPWTMSMIL